MIYGSKPSLKDIRIFGCSGFAQVPVEKRRKWDATSRRAIFMGYDEQTLGVLVMDAETRRLFSTTSFKADEDEFLNRRRNHFPSPARETEEEVVLDSSEPARDVSQED